MAKEILEGTTGFLKGRIPEKSKLLMDDTVGFGHLKRPFSRRFIHRQKPLVCQYKLELQKKTASAKRYLIDLKELKTSIDKSIAILEEETKYY